MLPTSSWSLSASSSIIPYCSKFKYSDGASASASSSSSSIPSPLLPPCSSYCSWTMRPIFLQVSHDCQVHKVLPTVGNATGHLCLLWLWITCRKKPHHIGHEYNPWRACLSQCPWLGDNLCSPLEWIWGGSHSQQFVLRLYGPCELWIHPKSTW